MLKTAFNGYKFTKSGRRGTVECGIVETTFCVGHYFTWAHTGANPNFLSKNTPFQKCEFCEKWDFENVNFVKIKILKLWILWKLRFSKCDFWTKCGFSPQSVEPWFKIRLLGHSGLLAVFALKRKRIFEQMWNSATAGVIDWLWRLWHAR